MNSIRRYLWVLVCSLLMLPCKGHAQETFEVPVKKDEVEEDLEVSYSGDELDIGFNVRYLIESLSVMSSSMVTLTFSDPNSSALISGEEGGCGRHVIMPMRI